MPERRFPPPWSVDEQEACFIVKTPTGRRSLHLLRGGAWRRAAAHLLTRDEARRIAANIAKLPELLGKA